MSVFTPLGHGNGVAGVKMDGDTLTVSIGNNYVGIGWLPSCDVWSTWRLGGGEREKQRRGEERERGESERESKLGGKRRGRREEKRKGGGWEERGRIGWREKRGRVRGEG